MRWNIKLDYLGRRRGCRPISSIFKLLHKDKYLSRILNTYLFKVQKISILWFIQISQLYKNYTLIPTEGLTHRQAESQTFGNQFASSTSCPF